MRSDGLSDYAPSARPENRQTLTTPHGLGAGTQPPWILPFIGGDEEVKRHRGTLAVGRHPDGLQALLGLRLQVFGQCVEHVGRLLHPTQLPTRRAVHVAQRLPATQCPIPKGQGWRLREPAAFEVAQECFPGLLALPIAIPETYQVFMATGISANNDQATVPRFLQAGLEVHSIDPDIDERFPTRLRPCPSASSSCQPCLSRRIVAGERPGASAPKSACKASETSPVEPPFRYSQGQRAARLVERRIEGGRSAE